MYNILIISSMFHKINLTTFRPTYFCSISSHHPDCRPSSEATWQLCPYLNKAISEAVFPSGYESGGGEVLTAKINGRREAFAISVYGQDTARNFRVLQAGVCVILPFIVVPANLVALGVVSPLTGVG